MYDSSSENLRSEQSHFIKIYCYQKDKKKRYKDVMFDHENFLILKMKFVRLMREVMQKYFNENLRIQFNVLNALQKIIKMFFFSVFVNICIILSHYFIIVNFLAMTNCLIIHVKRVIVQTKNMQLLMNLIKEIKYMNEFFRKKKHQLI